MNVILESEAGDELICIQSFLATPEGTRFSLKNSHSFRVGDRVRYAGFRQNPNLKDNPAGWMVVFDAVDGKRYAATQTYFLTEECWRSLEGFFVKRLRRRQKKTSAAVEGRKTRASISVARRSRS